MGTLGQQNSFLQHKQDNTMALSKEHRPLQEVNGRAKWSVQGMAKAVEVKAQRAGLRAAARIYGVPVTSLKRRVDTGLPPEAKPGQSTVLSREEDKLCKYIIDMAEMGYGLSGDM